MPDKLIIHDLATECRLGVYDWEKEKPQPVWIDIEVAIDARKAAKSDAMGDAVDYAALVTLVKTTAAERAYNLLETLADKLAEKIVQEIASPEVTVRVKKRALPGIAYAAVEVQRFRS